MATLEAFSAEARALIDGATDGVPASALKLADRISRRWLIKSGNAHLAEIDAIADKLRQPGAHYLSVNYEWGCTVAVRAAAGDPELVRVLDWRTPGLGRYIVAADVDGASGRFVTLTWPGYTGVLQAMAPGRFAAAINQAPMPRRGGGFMPLDWFANKVDVWRSRDATPAHLLRDVFEQAETTARPAAGSAKHQLPRRPSFRWSAVTPANCALSSAPSAQPMSTTARAPPPMPGRRRLGPAALAAPKTPDVCASCQSCRRGQLRISTGSRRRCSMPRPALPPSSRLPPVASSLRGLPVSHLQPQPSRPRSRSRTDPVHLNGH